MNFESEFPVILARAAIHPMRWPQLQNLAVHLVEAGFEAPELHELAWDTVNTTAEAQATFEAALPRIGWRLPSRQEAVAILLHHYCSQLACGESGGLDTFRTLCDEVIYPEIRAHDSSSHAGDTHDMSDLVTDLFVYDDMTDWSPNQSEVSRFLATVRIHARDRLSRHPSPPSLRMQGHRGSSEPEGMREEVPHP